MQDSILPRAGTGGRSVDRPGNHWEVQHAGESLSAEPCRKVKSDGLRYGHLVGADFVESVFASRRLEKPLNRIELLGLTPLFPLSIRPPILTQTIDRNRRFLALMFFED